MNQHLVILTGKGTVLEEYYFLTKMVSIWRSEGLQVSVQNNPAACSNADLVILHVDLTIIPDKYLKLIQKHPAVINGSVKDISKRLISHNILNRNDNYEGAVIVKTDKNYGGRKEQNYLNRKSKFNRIINSIRKRLPWGYQSMILTSDYPVFKSVNEVPPVVWYNPEFIVEKFIPEIQNEYYCLRTWVFLGDKETNSLSTSKAKIIKSNNVLHREIIEEVPDELRKVRQEMGFDYGKFDYVIADGKVVLYDVNRTPSIGSLSKDDFMPSINILAKGIYYYLAKK